MIIDRSSVRTAGSRPAQIHYAAGTPDVRHVIIGGRRVVSDGTHRLGVAGELLAAALTDLEDSWDPDCPGTTVITGIAELVTCDDSTEDRLGIRSDAAVVVADGRVAWIGDAAQAPAADRRIDLGGRALLPGFVDSHSHLVFAGDRSAEFAARMTGQAYDGGGIAGTVAATRSASDDELRALIAGRIAEMRSQGTTTVEIKSGYGLSVADEVRALRLAGEVTAETTFLGAHVVPPEWRDRRADYVALVTGEMLDAAAPYARWIDVFCEPASPYAFDGDEARAVLAAGRRAGLELRVHGNQLGPGPGVQLAVELGRPASTTARTCPTPTSTRFGRGVDDGGDAVARGRVLHPLALPRRGPAAGRRGVDRPRHRLQPRHLLLLLDAVHDRSGRPRDGADARRRPSTPPRPDRREPCVDRTSDGSRWAVPPTWPSSTPRATSISPTVRVCRWSGPRGVGHIAGMAETTPPDDGPGSSGRSR